MKLPRRPHGIGKGVPTSQIHDMICIKWKQDILPIKDIGYEEKLERLRVFAEQQLQFSRTRSTLDQILHRRKNKVRVIKADNKDEEL